jgi:hypothetical protein
MPALSCLNSCSIDHGDLLLAPSAYNSGAARVDKADGIPDIPETKIYVFSILNRFLQ